MPTVLKKDGFRFFFYSREGTEPPHIHVIGRGGEMKIWLNPIEISKIYRLSAKDQRAILSITQENAKLFIEKWKEWHESDGTKN